MNLYVSHMRTGHWQWHGSHRLPGSWFGPLRNASDLHSLLASRPYLHGRIPPVSDWTACLLVVTALGEAPTGGHAVKVNEIVCLADAIRVTVHVRSPAPTDLVIQALTYPVDSVCLRRDLVPTCVPWIFLDQTGQRLVSDIE